MASQGTVESPQVKLIRSFVEAFEKKDVDHIMTFLHKDLLRITHPRTLGRTNENREEWGHRIAEIVGLWSSCQVWLAGCFEPSYPWLNHNCRQLTIPFWRLPVERSSFTFVPPKRLYQRYVCVLKSGLAPQLNLLSKTPFGVEMDREMLFIALVVTDDDGSLKIKQFEEFVDSNVYLEFYGALAKAKADGLCSGSFAAA